MTALQISTNTVKSSSYLRFHRSSVNSLSFRRCRNETFELDGIAKSRWFFAGDRDHDLATTAGWFLFTSQARPHTTAGIAIQPPLAAQARCLLRR